VNLLFGRNPRQRDEFDVEADAAEAVGLGSSQVDLEALLNERFDDALATLPRKAHTFLYRGWMLTATEYAALEEALGERGHRLVTTAEEYESASYLPKWYPAVRGYTPRSVWIDGFSIAEAWTAAKTLGPPPWIIKDHLKSAKEAWTEACFIARDATYDDFGRSCERLMELRADRLERGVVIRRFVEFQPLGQTPTGPAFLEYRLFFSHSHLLAAESYFDFDVEVPDFSAFSRLARRIDTPFFTMDVGQLRTGDFAVIEVNDGGVSMLPASLDPRELFANLAAALRGR
jgi:hypothetical protein